MLDNPVPTSRSANRRFWGGLLVLVFVVGLFVGSLAVYFVTSQAISGLSNQVSGLRGQVSVLKGFENVTYENVTLVENSTSLSAIYGEVSGSVVLIEGDVSGGGVQGSGFVCSVDGRDVVLTNYHVVAGTTGLSVTFSDGKGFAASVLGWDPYADLAVVSVSGAPAGELRPLRVVSSSSLSVGDLVVAVGNPYGLVGSLTTGAVSALGRSITENSTGGFSIADIIQTSTPINPGNSGGPLLNAVGDVVGITTAIISNSQGLGFAIPSDTILREVSALVSSGSYMGHSYLGVVGEDMSYSLAQQTKASVTYGWKVDSVTAGGPSDGKVRVGDIIIALNSTVIRNGDDLSSYLEENTLPGDRLVLTVVRGSTQLDVTVVLGTRPAASS